MIQEPVALPSNLAAGRTVMSEANPGVVYRERGMVGWVLNLTVRGRGRVNRGEHAFTTTLEDLLLFPPEVKHDYERQVPPGIWVHLWVYFFPRTSWLEWLNWPEDPEGVRRLHIPHGTERQRIRKRLEDIVQITRSPRLYRHDFAMNALEEVLLLAMLFDPGAKEERLDERVRTVLDYLCAHYTEAITLEDVAVACGLSKSRMSHLFKAVAGVTPMQYLERYRIQRARELLLMTAKPVSQVAFDVGFENPFYFSRVFAKHTKQSPRRFRQGSE